MEDTAQQFDSLIEDHLAQYFDLKLKTDQKIASIDPHAPLGSQELVGLGQVSAPRPRVPSELGAPGRKGMILW